MSENGKREKPSAAGIVAIILAAGVVLALNLITGAILWAATVRLGVDVNSGISENGTQLLTGAFGGIIGILGGYLGYTLSEKKKTNELQKPEDEGTQFK